MAGFVLRRVGSPLTVHAAQGSTGRCLRHAPPGTSFAPG